MDFFRKTVVITGAAGGFGKPLVEAFTEKGAVVIAVDTEYETLSRAFIKPNKAIKMVAVDLTNETKAIEALSEAARDTKGIDVLCALAGGFSMGFNVHETPSETWELMIDVNLRTLINTVKAITPGMIARKSGKIITIGANAAKVGVPGMGAYCATKNAVMRLTESMALELRTKGINVNCVMPSVIDTKANRESMPKSDPKKWVHTNDLSSVVMFLASEKAKAIHGALIPVIGLS